MTKCSICEHANPPLAKQCENCGMQLIRDDERDVFGTRSGNQLQDFINSGRKIEAIKLYREQTGKGLKEAKEAVEAMMRGEVPTQPQQTKTTLTSADEQEILTQLRDGRKIEAIKIHRKLTGAGLRDAKLAVDRLAQEHGIQASGGGCLGFLLVGLCVTAAAGYLVI